MLAAHRGVSVRVGSGSPRAMMAETLVAPERAELSRNRGARERHVEARLAIDRGDPEDGGRDAGTTQADAGSGRGTRRVLELVK